MILNNYIYFIIFCILMVFSPGPMTMLLMSISAENGFKKTMPAQIGASSAYFLSLLFFSIGVTALLQQYTIILKTIQYIGVAYILYIAYKQWQNANSNNKINTDVNPAGNVSSVQLYKRGLITGLSNPKTIVMFTTVIPQFTQNTSERLSQLIILSVIFLILQFLSGVTYSYFGHAIKSFLQHKQYQKIMYRSIAVLLVIVAIMLAKA